jgi:hypothetical protein
VRALRCLALAGTLTIAGCGAWLPVARDVADIADVVIRDVMAGKPFATVLGDTGSDDAELLVAVIGAILADPKTDAPTKAAYAAKCQPYLDQAKVLAARQKAARGGAS